MMASNRPRIALIHALAHSVDPINEAMARDWPEATRMNLLDDSLSSDLAAGGRGLDTAMQERFERLAQYALDCGSDAILFTCSPVRLSARASKRSRGGIQRSRCSSRTKR